MKRKVESQYDKIARDYQKNLKDTSYYEKITAKFCSKVKGKILDAGCGNGVITNYIFLKNSQVTGIDISQGMIREAQKRYPKIKFQKMSMKELSFKDNSLDGIFCFQAFEHIPPKEQEKVLGEFFRVLKEDGILMFNTNNRFYPKRFLLAILNKVKYPRSKFGEIDIDGKTQTYRYLSTFPELKKKLDKIGFKISSHENPIFAKWIQIWTIKGSGT
jgi:ubiquinone/menaquinone biosynthesis C-methylase UbiE